jgi:pimeloyl-ACP methyl ester carboxylesterase
MPDIRAAAPGEFAAALELMRSNMAGHMVQLEASDEVNAILLDYLADIQQRR